MSRPADPRPTGAAPPSRLRPRESAGAPTSPHASLLEAPEVEVTLCPGGPALVRGATVVRDDAGTPHEVTRPIVAVCLCGKTQRAPWCDGTHKVIPKP